MSGGHFENRNWQAYYNLQEIVDDQRFKDEFPLLADEIGRLSDVINNVLREVDYYYSGDSKISDNFEESAIRRLK